MLARMLDAVQPGSVNPTLCAGACPARTCTCRWGHSSFVWGGRLWVYAGWDGSKHLDDLHSLDLQSMAWARVHQGSSSSNRPNRSLAKHKSFAPAVLVPSHGCMLAFGAEPQVRMRRVSSLPQQA